MKLRYLLLAVFGLVTAVPLLLFWLWPHSQSMTNEVEDVRERHLLIAETLGIALDSYYREVLATFRQIHVSLADHGEVEAAQALLPDLHFRNVCLFDQASGALALKLDSADNRCPETLAAERRTLLEALARSEAEISPVMAGPDGAPTLYLAEIRDGRLAVGSIGTDFFVHLAQSIAFGRQGHAVVVDQSGRVLGHPNAAWRYERRSMADIVPVRDVLAGRAGVGTYQGVFMPVEMIAGYTPVAATGWGVLVAQPVDELRDRAARVSQSALLVVIIGMMAALLIAYMVAFYMTRPLRAVSQAVRRMAAGNTEARTQVNTGLLVPEEVRDLQTSFNVMAEAMERSKRDEQEARLRAEEANRSKSAFLANMSHELRTPLNAILGFSEVILAETFGKIGSDRYAEYLRDIRGSARHLLELINDLLDLSRIEAGAVKLNASWMALADALEESASMFRESCASKDITLRLDCPQPSSDEGAVMILVDGRALRQILINLLSNAVRHTPAGGEVVLGGRAVPGNGLGIFVADTGSGIPAADLERVLHPFEQVARDQARPQEGTGLGLSIVKQLVELHGGTLTLESEVDKGTRVTFMLPGERVQRNSTPPDSADG